MQFVIAALIGAFVYAIGSIVGRVLLALGMGYVTFTGVSTLGDWLQNHVQTAFGGLAAEAGQFLAYLWVDKAITMVFSALVLALTYRMSGSSLITNLIVKGKA